MRFKPITVAVAAGLTISAVDGDTLRPYGDEPTGELAWRPAPVSIELRSETSTGESIAVFNIDERGTVYRW